MGGEAVLAPSAEVRRLVSDHARLWKRAGGGPPDYPPQLGWSGKLADAAFAKHDALLAHVAALEDENARLKAALTQLGAEPAPQPVTMEGEDVR